jgi:gamma-glutamylcyclotransferase (GGCT)/AIG2-like uncharacterized protein YtfP
VRDAVFVYGSLRSEFDNRYAVELRAAADLVGCATVTGSIFRVGRYPGYRAEPAGQVHGEVWRLRDPERTLGMLDEYEGSRYRRVLTSTSIPGVEAWIYAYAEEVEAGRRIESGDCLVS